MEEKLKMSAFKIYISKRALQSFGKINKNETVNKETNEKKVKEETDTITIMLR